LETQRSIVHSIVVSPNTEGGEVTANDLNSKMLKTELEVQDSRSILAQLRLRGEQRISRGKRAAAAAAAASSNNNIPTPSMPITKEEKVKTTKPKATKKKQQQLNKTITPHSISVATDAKQLQQPFYFQGMMLDNNTDYDQGPPGHGMDWTLFDNQQQDMFNNNHHLMMFPEKMMPSPISSSRSSSLTSSHHHYPTILQPSNSTTSTTTTCSSISDNSGLFSGFNMVVDEMILQQQEGLYVIIDPDFYFANFYFMVRYTHVVQ
jgi:hypothetical protein